MSVHIEFDDWFSANGRGVWSPVPRFHLLDDAEQSLGIVLVLLSGTAEAILAAQLGFKDQFGKGTHVEPVVRAMLRYGVHAIERGLQQGTLPPEDPNYAAELRISSDEVPLLMQLAGEKECEYQAAQGRDLFCLAASEKDAAARWAIDGRSAAPTSRPICAACALPDTDYLCSNFSHARVTSVMTRPEGYDRMLVSGLCQKGRPEIGTPTKCRPGQNPCWERHVDLSATTPVSISAPLQLPETVDHLDMAWRLVYGRDRRLVRAGGVADIAALMLPCASREEFESRLSDLVDLLKRLDIDDDALPEKARALPRDRTLDRLEAALLDRINGVDSDEVIRAVRVLRAVGRIRVGQQHSTAQQRTLESFELLGLKYPVADWDETWSKVRSAAAEAFLSLAHVVRRLEARFG